MYTENPETRAGAGLRTPVRNSYFYGQLLGVASLELETDYAIAQRRLLNRLVLGWGVICGLDVEVSDDGARIRVLPGVVLDRWGREIIVPEPTPWTPVPPAVLTGAVQRAKDCKEEACVQVLICYHECRGDPEPVYAGDCDSADPCAPSTLRERYRLDFRDRCAKQREHRCNVKDLISHGDIDHAQLARWVTEDRDCTRVPRDPCVPLANVGVIDGDTTPRCDRRAIDIGVRPVLASNAVLMELVLALLERDRQEQQY
jgi:hypothetical protein